MKMYYANTFTLTIEERDVVRQPEREPEGFGLKAIDPYCNAWFVYHEMAKKHLVDYASKEIVRCEMSLNIANEAMKKVKSL